MPLFFKFQDINLKIINKNSLFKNISRFNRFWRKNTFYFCFLNLHQFYTLRYFLRFKLHEDWIVACYSVCFTHLTLRAALFLFFSSELCSQESLSHKMPFQPSFQKQTYAYEITILRVCLSVCPPSTYELLGRSAWYLVGRWCHSKGSWCNNF
jgi:hypothetical protein